jgi:acyl carrier protein
MTKGATMKKRVLFEWLEGIFQESPGSINEGRKRESIPNWDSMGTLLLIAELDEKLHVSLSEYELRSLASVADLVTMLESKQITLEDP